MIEIIYKDETGESKEQNSTFYIPRNIRQIGLGGGKYRIYIEDYVYTFLHRIAEKGKNENGGMAILMGKAEWNEGVTYIFIKGAVCLEETVNTEHISLENDSWKTLQDAGTKYFSELNVVGWFLAIPQMTMEVTEIIERAHLKYFSGSEKVLMMMEPVEKEEAFYYYDNGNFIKTSGYYLYYEKNVKMQEYITDVKWWENSETEKIVPDEAVKRFRKKIIKTIEQNEGSEEKKSLFSYAATACLVVAIMATGAGFIKNYQQIQLEEQELEASAVLTVNDQFESSPLLETEEVTTEEAAEEEIAEIDREEKEAKVEECITEEKTGNEEAEENDEIAENKQVAENKKSAEREKDENTEGTVEETEITEGKENKSSKETSGNSVFETYMIRPGDTLYQISILNYGNMEAIEEICRLNNISEEEKIYPGQIIVLP